MYETIKQDILEFFIMYAEHGTKLAWLSFILVFFPFGWYNKRYREKGYFGIWTFAKSLTVALLVMYVYIVIGITMLSRSEGQSTVINLKLFSTFSSSPYDLLFIYENILLFVPLGILLFILAKPFRDMYVSFIIGGVCSFAIERAQLATNLGMFQIDDILTNTMGMMCGFVMCKTIAVFYTGIRTIIQWCKGLLSAR